MLTSFLWAWVVQETDWATEGKQPFQSKLSLVKLWKCLWQQCFVSEWGADLGLKEAVHPQSGCTDFKAKVGLQGCQRTQAWRYDLGNTVASGRALVTAALQPQETARKRYFFFPDVSLKHVCYKGNCSVCKDSQLMTKTSFSLINCSNV